MPELDKITATIDVLRIPAGFKVRAYVWSGPDFKWPHITRGAITSDEEVARSLASRFVEACEQIGIPVDGSFVVPDGHASAPAVLPETHEGQEYNRL